MQKNQSTTIENVEITKSLFFLNNIVTNFCYKSFGWKKLGERDDVQTTTWEEEYTEDVYSPFTATYSDGKSKAAYGKASVKRKEQKHKTTVTRKIQYSRLLPCCKDNRLKNLEFANSLLTVFRNIFHFLFWLTFTLGLFAFLIEKRPGLINPDEFSLFSLCHGTMLFSLKAYAFIILGNLFLGLLGSLAVKKYRKEQIAYYESRLTRLKQDYNNNFINEQTYRQILSKILNEYNLIK